MTIQSIVILHKKAGETDPEIHVLGGSEVRLFYVDDNAPDDRVFEWLPRSGAGVFREIIPEGTEIGSSADTRHAAIERKVLAFLDGRKPLTVVE